ncbi:MAG: 4Fe4S-binding leucine-rich repeat protein [Acidobacteriaceae bacterium]
MTRKPDEALDWQGNKLCCDGCVHRELIREDLCRKRHVCVQDRSPSRIAQFFKSNPSLANEFLTHPYFEVRAAAAKFADVFRLPALLNDEDESVRWNAALRLPHRFVLRLRDDAHREVRIRVASHLEGEELMPMMSDPDYFVRQIVARRIGAPQLKHMIDDPDPEVRRVVAQRIAPEWLLELVDDPDGSVCLAVAERLAPAQLLPLRFHPDMRIRYEAAGRVPIGALGAMRLDADPLVRERVEERLAAIADSTDAKHTVIEMDRSQWEGKRL